MKNRDIKRGHLGKVILTTFLVLVVAVMLAVLAEGIVRVRQWIKYERTGTIDKIYQTDSSLSLRVPIANEVQGGIRINSLGFRGPELEDLKPDSLVRLAFLGASTTFCAEVSSNEITWPHLVWKRLKESFPGTNIDYVNAAVSGYTVDSSIKNLKYRVEPLKPDVIIIYHTTNDLSKDSRALAGEQGIYQSSDNKRIWISEYSLLWRLVEKNLKIRMLQKDAIGKTKLKFDPQQLSRDFKRRMTALIKESQKVAPLVVVVTFSHKIRREQSPQEQLKAANTALYYMPFMSTEGLLSGYEEYNRVIREVAKERDAALIGEEMSIPGDDAHFYDSVHFTDTGSKLMAKRVSDAVLNSAEFREIIRSKMMKSADFN